ncbi:MAG: hypothetical protein ACSHXF_04685 [Aquaticitalea sp.]
MKLNLIYLTFIIGILNISIIHSQSDLKLVKKKNGNTVHFTMVDKTPFESDCDGISDDKERTQCLEKSLRDQILNLIDKDYEYFGEMYVWFTVDKKGNVTDIATKGYPSAPEFENDIKKAVTELNLNKSTYKNRKVDVRCYTRVLPKIIEPKK